MAKRARQRPSSDDDLDGIEAIDRLAGWARKFVGIISTVLAAIFVGIQLKEVPFAELAQKTSPRTITTAAIIIYYACWIGGSNFDIKLQQRVYITDPKRGQITAETVGIVTIFFIATAALIYASKDVILFAAVLAPFVIANIIGVVYMMSRVRPAIDKSRETYLKRGSYFRLEQLRYVEHYLTGRWQTYRFIGMLLMIAGINIICHFPAANIILANVISLVDKKLDPGTVTELLPSAAILLYVLIAELWIWLKRLMAYSALNVIDGMRSTYSIKRQPEPEPL